MREEWSPINCQSVECNIAIKLNNKISRKRQQLNVTFITDFDDIYRGNIFDA